MASPEQEINPEQQAAIQEQLQKAVDLAGGDAAAVMRILQQMGEASAPGQQEFSIEQEAGNIIEQIGATQDKMENDINWAKRFDRKALANIERQQVRISSIVAGLAEQADARTLQELKVAVYERLGLTLDDVEAMYETIKKPGSFPSTGKEIADPAHPDVLTEFRVGYTSPASDKTYEAVSISQRKEGE